MTFLRTLFLYSLCYFVIVALAHVRYYASLSYERDLRAATLETQLAEARLTALQGQLRPHFLFNTLNMIAEQVYTDPAGADAMLTRLGVLLRSSFTEADRERVPDHGPFQQQFDPSETDTGFRDDAEAHSLPCTDKIGDE